MYFGYSSPGFMVSLVQVAKSGTKILSHPPRSGDAAQLTWGQKRALNMADRTHDMAASMQALISRYETTKHDWSSLLTSMIFSSSPASS
jgi:hypothetical protein